MTQKQKDAIKILNKVRDCQGLITEEEYMDLLEFIVNSKEDVQLIPYTPPYYTEKYDLNHVKCRENDDNKTKVQQA